MFALLVAAAMGQIASAYPTAGGLYHWGSILGGKGRGWATAWINLVGLLFVVSSVNYGVYLLLRDLVLIGVLGMKLESFTNTHLIIAVTVITLSQATLNYAGIRVTTILTDFSGYLILAVSIALNRRADRGLSGGARFLAADPLHQQHRQAGRRRLAGDLEPVLRLRAGAPARLLHDHAASTPPRTRPRRRGMPSARCRAAC